MGDNIEAAVTAAVAAAAPVAIVAAAPNVELGVPVLALTDAAAAAPADVDVDDEEIACSKDFGREADKANAAAAAAVTVALLLRSLAVVVVAVLGEALPAAVVGDTIVADRDSNCRRGCLKIKLLDFEEFNKLLPPKVENAFEVAAAKADGFPDSKEFDVLEDFPA